MRPHPSPPPPPDVKFGTVFSDHMFTVEHVTGQGWGMPSIGPFQNMSIHPAAPVLHYGLCCFEGMKAYAAEDGSIRLFRPEMNMARMQRSVARLELAPYDPEVGVRVRGGGKGGGPQAGDGGEGSVGAVPASCACVRTRAWRGVLLWGAGGRDESGESFVPLATHAVDDWHGLCRSFSSA